MKKKQSFLVIALLLAGLVLYFYLKSKAEALAIKLSASHEIEESTRDTDNLLPLEAAELKEEEDDE